MEADLALRLAAAAEARLAPGPAHTHHTSPCRDGCAAVRCCPLVSACHHDSADKPHSSPWATKSHHF